MKSTLKRADALAVGDTLLHRDAAVMRDIEHVVTALARQPGNADALRVTVAPHGVLSAQVTWVLDRDERVKVKVEEGHEDNHGNQQQLV